MSAVLLALPHSIDPRDGDCRAPEVPADPLPVAIDGTPSSAGFALLLGAYRSSGGTARGDDLARLLEDHHRGEYLSLARLIAAGDVFGFEWRHAVWVPMFQFDSHDLAVKQSLQPVLVELTKDFGSWPIAAWFVNGNAHLGGQRPVDLLDRDLKSVITAARTDAPSQHRQLVQTPIPRVHSLVTDPE